ncbi:hypothetical protein [Pandoraea pneumonica]|nr:hypothetical protein [Pandoraea pneumonica]
MLPSTSNVRSTATPIVTQPGTPPTPPSSPVSLPDDFDGIANVTSAAKSIGRSAIAHRQTDELDAIEAVRKRETLVFAIRFEGNEVPVRLDLTYDAWYGMRRSGERQYFRNDGADVWIKRAPPTPASDPVLSIAQRQRRLMRMGYRSAARAAPVPPENVRTPLPRVAHAVWLGGKLSTEIFANLAWWGRRFEKASPAYAVQIYVLKTQAQAPSLHRQLACLPNVTVKLLTEQPFFRTYAASPSFAMFRELTAAKYWSAPHDAIRYRLLHALGGILFDPLDKLRFGAQTLPDALAFGDVTVGVFLLPTLQRQHSPLHVGIMASLPGNPVMEVINDTMWQKWRRMTCDDANPRYREWLSAPTKAPDVWLTRALSELCGPHLVSNVLCDWVPGIRTMVELMKAHEDGVEMGADAQPEYAPLMDYYFAFDNLMASVDSADDRRDINADLKMGALARAE